MAKVECIEFPELTCWFWSNDHDPPHFHVKREGEWELKVSFLVDEGDMFELVWGTAPRAKVLRHLAEAVRMNRAGLLAEWQAKVSHDN